MRLPILLAVCLAFCCAGQRNIISLPEDAPDVKSMMESTVQIRVKIEASLLTKDEAGEVQETKLEEGWSGSGVVYDKTEGLVNLSAPRSRILSANHVLEAPHQGDVAALEEGILIVTSVDMTILTADGRTCNLTPLALGENTDQDVATAEADCDAGRVAKIASVGPQRGEKVFVSGHSLGVPLAMVTEGYVSGWMERFVLISAGAAPGNSGGPVFYNGEVVGLLVRGAPRYQNISLMTPLEAILKRISETPAL